MHDAGESVVSRRRDEGAILPLVLIMIVIGALIVLPLIRYSISVLRANEVEADRTRHAEAAKAGIRVALGDPANVFTSCNNSADLTPATPIIDGISVSVSCLELDETGPLEVLGFQIPMANTTMQLGATVPTSFTGNSLSSDPVPPYPADEAWWSGQESSTAVTDTIWLPQLPVRPSVAREPTPYPMPAGFACSVFLPGYYPDPVSVTGTVYFASGVYYFEDEVRIEGTSDVVVGQGLEDFGTDCADDIQVATNILDHPVSGPPVTFGIDGGGGTWIFGDEGRLVIDNSASASLSLRFNQRYADVARGGRVSIMSVNGDDVDPVDHVVTNVSSVDRSTVLTSSGPVLTLGDSGAEYLPSSSTYTDKARPAEPPVVNSVVGLIDPAGTPTGVARVEWNEVTGQDAGGTLVEGFEVQVSPAPAGPAPCDLTEIVPAGDGTFSCLVRGLTPGVAYDVSVATKNSAGTGTPGLSVSVTPPVAPGPSDFVDVPDSPVIDAVVETGADDEALVSWTVPFDGGAPIVSYDVKAYRVFNDVPIPPAPPVEQPPVLVSSCSPPPATTWEPAALSCVVSGLPDLTQPEDVGYRFSVTATSSLGDSAELIADPPSGPVLAFDGGGTDPDPPTTIERIVEPWIPEPIIDVQAPNNVTTHLSVPGHIAVPMGRIGVDNPNGLDINITGGVVTGTFDVNDSREDLAVPGSVPIGFKNDIVLQREVRLTSRAGNITSVAVAKINEDGAAYALSAWVTQ